MNTDRQRIVAAMSGKMGDGNAALVADILCRDPAECGAPAVIDDEAAALLPEDGGADEPVKIAPLRYDRHPRPYMIELPTPLLSAAWFQNGMRARLGPVLANAMYTDLRPLGEAAMEPLYLAAVLREAYGPDGLPDRVDAAVFSQPAYAPFRDGLLPLLEKYVYP